MTDAKLKIIIADENSTWGNAAAENAAHGSFLSEYEIVNMTYAAAKTALTGRNPFAALVTDHSTDLKSYHPDAKDGLGLVAHARLIEATRRTAGYTVRAKAIVLLLTSGPDDSMSAELEGLGVVWRVKPIRLLEIKDALANAFAIAASPEASPKLQECRLKTANLLRREL